jgi:hypothetical protein
MIKLKRCFFCFLFLYAGSHLSFSQQSIVMNENDVDMKIQTWHYQYYANSKIIKWTLIPKDGNAYYKAEFTWNEGSFESYYNEKADILFEKQNIPITSVPEPVIALLDYRIVKYKISTFTKETQFENRKPVNINYMVDARTKTGGQVMYWFDANFSIVPEVKNNLYFMN